MCLLWKVSVTAHILKSHHGLHNWYVTLPLTSRTLCIPSSKSKNESTTSTTTKPLKDTRFHPSHPPRCFDAAPLLEFLRASQYVPHPPLSPPTL